MNVENRTIFEGDNLHILRGLDSEIIDLIYLDPPFNSNRIYEAPIGSDAAGAAFKDAWTLSDLDNAWHGELAEEQPALYSAISASGETHGKSMKSYLIMIAVRMIEMKQVLKETGSIYLHCDPTASHYLKMVMDSVFGGNNFRNEIVWQRASGRAKGSQHKSKSLGRDTDNILHYSKSENFLHNAVNRPLTEAEIQEKFPLVDENKRRYNTATPIFCQPSMGDRPNLCYEYKGVVNPHPSGWRVSKEKLIEMDKAGYIIWREGKRPLRKAYADEYKGKPIGSLWTDIPIAAGNERTGYPTQKPLKLLERIIKASSNRGDLVLDPFCGCATTCIAAESLQRQWIGIDISPKAIELLKLRLERDLNLTEDTGILGQVIHRTTPPTRSDPSEPRQIHFEGLFSVKDADLAENLSQRDLWRFKTDKHILFGTQEGKCAGCKSEYHFRNLTIDHRDPRSKGGSDHLGNLQLLCNWCNSVKGDRPQAYLDKRLKEEGILR